jgi:hypothetical protein
VVAGTRDNLSDIAYQNTGWGSEQLRFRGYTRTSSHWHDGRMYEYWWQANSNTCIQARSLDVRYEVVHTTSATDCGQYHRQATSNDAAAAVAIGAATLAHNTDERSSKHQD